MTSRTILLDLDDTLLGNDMASFLPPYFAALHQYFADWIDLPTLQHFTMASVQVIQSSPPPQATHLLDAFLMEFARRINRPIEHVQQAWDTFYRTDFPKLKKITTHRPQAAAVVRRLLADGRQVVIATNPLFPATAIEQRMAWAGIKEFPFALVTTMENSHYFKPNPDYYREILAKTGSAPETTWMVGDDPVNDIKPARSLGLKTWWITPDGAAAAPPACDMQGTLTDFLAWIEAGKLP